MILIKNGRVFTMSGKVFDRGEVLIENNKIKAVGENLNAPKECRVIDVQGGWVMPGLIDAHSHIGITEEKKGFDGDDCNEAVHPVLPYLRSLDAINPMDSAFHMAISSGITSVMVGPGSSNVVGGQFLFMKTYGRNIDEMVIKEPAAMKIAFGENPKNTYFEKGMMPSTRMSIGALLREELFNAREYCIQKQEAEKNGKHFEKDFEMECWESVFKRQIPLKAHVHRADDILTAIRIAKEFNLDTTLDHCSEGHLIAHEVKSSGFPAIIGPSLAFRNKIEIQYMKFETAGVLARAGVKVAITTDHPVSRISSLAICAGLAVKEGLELSEGLRAITINAAQICRTDDRVGSLEAGKDADIAIFDDNPMKTFTRTLYTIINGKVIYDNGRFVC
ncbi:MAG: amidohydrolase [Bacillota bacterium]|jgi:imidazolonepropionase-like amidohydrolase|nr:amidohydrolase [Bacillota bacterium]HHU42720.1 amidohydrolase [Clostridiales bacterium]